MSNNNNNNTNDHNERGQLVLELYDQGKGTREIEGAKNVSEIEHKYNRGELPSSLSKKAGDIDEAYSYQKVL
ncbi:MAG TPA: hypothetical protein VIW25_04050 [Nitrososphaeraceae archaeon]|jgi:hypothetical protein